MKSKVPLIYVLCLALVIAAALVCFKSQVIAAIYGQPRGILADLSADTPRGATTTIVYSNRDMVCANIHLPWTSTADESSALAKAMGRTEAFRLGNREWTLRKRDGEYPSWIYDCDDGWAVLMGYSQDDSMRETCVVVGVIRGMMIE